MWCKNMKLSNLRRIITEIGERLSVNIEIDKSNPMRSFRVAMFYSLFSDVIDGLNSIEERFVNRIKKRLKTIIESKEFSEEIKKEARENLKTCDVVNKLLDKIKENIIIKADTPEELKPSIEDGKKIDELVKKVLQNIKKWEFVFTKSEISALEAVIGSNKLKELIDILFKLWLTLSPSTEIM